MTGKANEPAHKRWYKTARWQKLRWSVLVRDMFTCQSCGKIEHDTSKLHCDHIDPHRGDEAKFWAGPFQTLCANCHNSMKQSQEKGSAPRATFTASGRVEW